MAASIGFDGGRLRLALPEQAHDSLGQRRPVVRIDQHADPLVDDGIATAPANAADDTQSASCRLEIDDAEAFLRAWHDVEIGETIEIGQLLFRNVAKEVDHARAGQFGRPPFETLTVVAVAGDDVDQLRKPDAQRRQNREYL